MSKGKSGEGAWVDVCEAKADHMLSEKVWDCWAEAAAVTLSRFHKAPPPPTPLEVAPTGVDPVRVHLKWPAPDKRALASHANEQNATEWGAYVLAAIAVRSAGAWRVRGRANHASGADLVMLRDDDDPENFVKLEVSGVAKGSGNAGAKKLRDRLREKIDQAGRGDLDRPGVAVVVGFEAARALVSEVQR